MISSLSYATKSVFVAHNSDENHFSSLGDATKCIFVAIVATNAFPSLLNDDVC